MQPTKHTKNTIGHPIEMFSSVIINPITKGPNVNPE